MPTKSDIIRIINNKPQFKLGGIFDDGFNYGIRSIGWMLLLLVGIFAYSFLIGLIPRYYVLDFSLIDVLNQLFVMVGLTGGLALFFHRRAEKGVFDFADNFRGFQRNYGNLVAFAAINFIGELFLQEIFSLALGTNLSFSSGGANAISELASGLVNNWHSLLGIGLFVFFVKITIQILLFFSVYFIVIYRFTALDSIILSFKLASKYFLNLVWFLIILLLLNFIGALLLGLGLIVTIPVTIAASYMVFNKLVVSQLNQGKVESKFIGDDILDA